MLSKRPDRFSQLLARLIKDEHRGQHLVTTSGLSAAEHAELRSLADDANASFREELLERTAKLRDLLAEGDPLYIASMVLVSNLLRGWGTYYEPTAGVGEPKVELVAGLLASQPAADTAQPPTGEQMQKIHDEIDEIFQLLFLVNFTMPRGDDLGAAALRFTGAMHWMTLRGTSYSHHGADLAREVYTPHNAWMLQAFGFTVDDVLNVGATAEGLTVGRLNALIQASGAFADAVLKHLGSPQGRGALSERRRAQVDSEEGRFQIFGAAFFDVFQTSVREAATFSSDELVEANDQLVRERVEAVLRELSLSVGALEPKEYTGLFDPNPLAQRPFLEHDGRHLLAIPGMVLRETISLLQDRVMGGVANFAKSRAKTLDRLAVNYLSDMLPGAQTYTNLYYADAELDGLVLLDDVALVVEGKATALSVQARRGDVERLRRDLGRGVEEAWEQGARAREFIVSGDDAVFTDRHGNELVRPLGGSINEVFIVNPTLHELGGHAPQLGRLRSLGLFPKEELPWSVFINDLRVISETCDNAAIFLHYLVWRSRLPLGDRIVVMDELDVWGSYLLCERFGMLAASSGQVTIGNSSTDFDAYYAGIAGDGPPARRPSKFLTEPVKAFVERLATQRPPGWREAAGACLDMSIPELAAVSAKAADVARDAEGRHHPVEVSFGRTTLVAVPRDVEIADLASLDAPNGDPTLIIYCRTARSKVEVLWARYARPVTFELSEFERAAFNAPETSPFASAHPQ